MSASGEEEPQDTALADPGGEKEAGSCMGRQAETATGSESATCTGWDRGCQSTALWDIVCLALPFVSVLWNTCSEKRGPSVPGPPP